MDIESDCKRMTKESKDAPATISIRELELLKARLLIAEHDKQHLETELHNALSEFSRINAELVSVYQSTRWNITWPLAKLKQILSTKPAEDQHTQPEMVLPNLDTAQKNVLVIDRSIPMPDQDAGSRALLGYIHILQDMGYQINLLGEDFTRPQPYTDQLERQGVVVLGGMDGMANWRRWLEKNAHALDVVILSRPNVAERFMPSVRELSTAKVIYMGQDLHFLRMQRESEIEQNISKKEIELVRASELIAMSCADATLMYSDVERQVVKESFDLDICTVPLYFYKEIPAPPQSFEDTSDLLFVGGFQHHPNQDAMLWFVDKVLPDIQKQLKDVKLYIVGAQPTAEIYDLQSQHVHVTGFVSEEELDMYYKKSRVCVVPLRYGAGVKGKTLEAMYHGIPVVSTSVGVEGMPKVQELIPGTDSATDFCKRVVQLYTDESAWQKQSQRQCGYLLQHYSYDSAKKIMERILDE